MNTIRKFQAVTNGRKLSETMANAVAAHVEQLEADSSPEAAKEAARLSIVLTAWDDAQEALWD